MSLFLETFPPPQKKKPNPIIFSILLETVQNKQRIRSIPKAMSRDSPISKHKAIRNGLESFVLLVFEIGSRNMLMSWPMGLVFSFFWDSVETYVHLRFRRGSAICGIFGVFGTVSRNVLMFWSLCFGIFVFWTVSRNMLISDVREVPESLVFLLCVGLCRGICVWFGLCVLVFLFFWTVSSSLLISWLRGFGIFRVCLDDSACLIDCTCLFLMYVCLLQHAQIQVCHHVHSDMHVHVQRYEISVQTRATPTYWTYSD